MSKKEIIFLIIGIILSLPLILMFPQILSADGSDIQLYNLGIVGNVIISIIGGSGFILMLCTLFKSKIAKIISCVAICFTIFCIIMSFVL